MNYFKFLYDLFVWITNNYSQLPTDFKKRFPESRCVISRLYISSIVTNDSEFNEDFKDYE